MPLKVFSRAYLFYYLNIIPAGLTAISSFSRKLQAIKNFLHRHQTLESHQYGSHFSYCDIIADKPHWWANINLIYGGFTVLGGTEN